MLEATPKSCFIIGAKQVGNAIKAGKASKVYVASDSESKIIEPIVALAKEYALPLVYIETRKELGTMCGIDVKSACAVETI